MTDNSKRAGAAIEAHYQFLAWLVPTIEKFPKSHKFTIGDRIEMIVLDVLEALIEVHLHQGADASFLQPLRRWSSPPDRPPKQFPLCLPPMATPSAWGTLRVSRGPAEISRDCRCFSPTSPPRS
jgi:hypothetical protein